MTEDDFDKKLKDLLKTENQLDKLKPVEQALNDMGVFYTKIVEKLAKDRVCYLSKEPIDDTEEYDVIVVPENKVDPGLIAFVSVKKKYNTEE